MLDQAASSPSSVSGVSASRKPSAARRNDRSREPTVVESAASRLASATSDAPASAARWEPHRQAGGDECDDEDGGQPDGQPTGAVAGPRLAAGTFARLLELGVGPRLGGVEELRSTAVGSSGAPAAQSSAAPRRAPRYSSSSGSPRRCHSSAAGVEMPAHRAPDGVVLQPSGQPRPCGQQRLVRDVEAVAVHDEQPPVDEGVHHRTACVAVRPVERQLGEGSGTPDECAALVGVRQPHEQPPGQLLARRVQRGVGRLRRSGERAGDAAGLEVAGQGQPIVPAALPGADERRREQRQGAGPAADVGHHGVEELVVRGQSDRRRRRLHDLAQLRFGECRHEDEPRPEALGERRVLGQPAEVVAADDHHAADDDPVVQQSQDRIEEGRPFHRVDPGRPELLELVADQEHGPRRGPVPGESGERVHGSAAGGHDERLPGGAAGEGAAGERRNQAGPDERGLAGAARAGHHELGSVDQPGHQPGDQPAPAVEERGVGRLIRGQPLVRAHGDVRRRTGARRRDGEVQGGILSEDRRLDGAQPGAGVGAQLLGEDAPRPGDRGQRVALPAAAVERDHQQPPPLLLEWVPDEEPLRLRGDLGVRAQGEPGLQERGDGAVAHLGEAMPLRLRERGVRPVAVGLAPPEIERGGQPPHRLGGISRCQPRAPPGHQPATCRASTSSPARA